MRKIIKKEMFSKDLSPKSKEKLIDFIESYIETLIVSEVDEKADIAKEKAIEVLKTDIDILNFVTVLWTMRKEALIISNVINKKLTSKKAAKFLVEAFEENRRIDKALRLLPPGSGIRFD